MKMHEIKYLRILTVLAAFLLGIAIISGCGSPERSSKTLVIGVPSRLNLGSNNPVMVQRNTNVWETLTDLDHSLVSQPKLATSWQVSADGMNWTFRLRQGVVFHDGAVLNAELVRKNIRRLKEHPELDYYSVYTHLESVEAEDDSTVVCVFSRPIVDLPNKVGHYFAGIFSPASWGEDGKLSAPVGCGPFTYEGGEIGQYDKVAAFSEYYKGKPYFDHVEFRIIPDPVVRIMSLLRGDIDMIAHHGGVPANQRSMLTGKANVKLDSLDVAITHYMLFNCARPPFDNAAARDAFDRILDRDELVTRILSGAGTAAHDYFIEKAVLWDSKRFSIHPDPSLPASDLPAELKTRPLVLLANQGDMNSWGYRRVVDYLVDYCQGADISLSVEVLEGGAWQDATRDGKFDITLYPLSMPTGTPELFIRRLAYSEGMRVRSIGNTTHYSSAVLDSLFEASLGASTLERQQSMFNSILDMLAQEKPVVPLFHERYYFAYRTGLEGVALDPFLKPDLHALRESQQ